MCLKTTRTDTHTRLPERAGNWKTCQKTVSLIEERINTDLKKIPQTVCSVCACVCVFINMHKMLQLQGVYEQKKVGEEQSGRIDGVQSRSASRKAFYSDFERAAFKKKIK